MVRVTKSSACSQRWRLCIRTPEQMKDFLGLVNGCSIELMKFANLPASLMEREM